MQVQKAAPGKEELRAALEKKRQRNLQDARKLQKETEAERRRNQEEQQTSDTSESEEDEEADEELFQDGRGRGGGRFILAKGVATPRYEKGNNRETKWA